MAKDIERNPSAFRLTFKGMNTVFPPDAQPENKYPYALNCRAYQAGAVGPRKPQSAPVYANATGVVHSLKRLNDNNVSPGYGVWVSGSGTVLNVGSALAVTTGFSGNRLAMVSYRPAASPRPWMYIADSNRAVKVNAQGVPSTFNPANTGIAEPQDPVIATDGGVSATGPTMPVFYQYKYRSSQSGALSNPSPPMRVGFNVAGHAVNVAMDPPSDPQADLVDVYRQDPGLLDMTYIGTIGSAVGTFFDNINDVTLLSNPLMQFDDYEPFPSIDLPRNFVATVTSAHLITWTGGDKFNLRWLPGTLIVRQPTGTGGVSALTLYNRPPTITTMNILEDLTAFIGASFAFYIAEPILAAQRLPTLWGPTDNAGFFFAVGDPLRPGTLYFTKGNNPDSAPQTNQIEVTSPSEPLINGAIVNGLGIVMSTERAWLAYPNFSNAVATVIGVQGSPFQLIETITGYGLYAKEGICTDGGAILYFWSKEGIRKSPGGFGSESITDADLYNLFPHEGQPQQNYVLGAYTVKPPDYTNPDSFALRFAEGYVYADYQDAADGYWTLVFDTVTSGWAVDQYQAPVAIHADTEGQGIGTGTGCTDGTIRTLSPTGTEVQNMVLAMPSFDAGDIRATKRFADLYVEAGVQAGDTVALDLWLGRYITHQNAALSLVTLPATGGVRTGVVIELAAGKGVYTTDIALVFTVGLAPSPTTLLYVWQPTLVPLPETIGERATDWDDGGIVGAKFVQGCRIEADTGNLSKSLAIQSSDDLSVNLLLESPAKFNGQSTWSFSVAVPFIAHSMRLVPQDTVPWRLWRVVYEFVPYPSLALEWQTELISHGLLGWQHIKEINLPYLSTSPLILTLTPDPQSPAIPAITVPSSAGKQTKLLLIMPPNKFKLVAYGLSGVNPFRVWKEDMEVKVGSWGRGDAYQILKPFGGESSEGATL